MAVKFNEYWNVLPQKWEEYVEFMQRNRIPTLNSLGVNVAAIWCALIGASPQIISEGIARDFDSLETALKDPEFMKTNTKLLTLVSDYRSKVLVPTGRFPNLPRIIERGTVKFSQYWDIIPGKENEYENFIKNVHYPAMEELDIYIGGEWKVLIGESPNIFYEGRSDRAEKLLSALQSQKFRAMKNELLKLVSNYSSRVLIYHAFKSKSGKSNEYEFNIV